MHLGSARRLGQYCSFLVPARRHHLLSLESICYILDSRMFEQVLALAEWTIQQLFFQWPMLDAPRCMFRQQCLDALVHLIRKCPKCTMMHLGLGQIISDSRSSICSALWQIHGIRQVWKQHSNRHHNADTRQPWDIVGVWISGAAVYCVDEIQTAGPLLLRW